MIISPNRGKILLETIHGSRLYGTNHEGSDEDYYFITEYGKGKSYKYTKDDGSVIDYHVIGFKDHEKKLLKGTHQAIEAAFSPIAKIDPSYQAYFDDLRLYSAELDRTFTRTVKGMCLREDTFKLKRHALRVFYNLLDLREYGRFNPRMSSTQLQVSAIVAEELTGPQLWSALKPLLDSSWRTF